MSGLAQVLRSCGKRDQEEISKGDPSAGKSHQANVRRLLLSQGYPPVHVKMLQGSQSKIPRELVRARSPRTRYWQRGLGPKFCLAGVLAARQKKTCSW